MVRIGIAGIGFMGMIHYLAYQRVPGMKVVAICSRDRRKRSGDWQDIQGNFGPAGKQMELSGVATYKNYADLANAEDIDLVDICLPPAKHEVATLEALKADKDVFCEKPMALTAKQCRRMVATAQKEKRQLLIGHVLPFFPEYAFVQRVSSNGKYGRVLGGNFKRVISDPLWVKDFFVADRVGGPMIDLHVHDAHFIRLLMGMPIQVVSHGRLRGQVVEYCQSLFRFDDPSLVVGSTSGVINQQGRSFTHGFEIHFENATILFESAVINGKATTIIPLTVLNNKGKAQQPKLKSGGDPIDAFACELKEVAKCLKTRQPSSTLDGSLASDAILLCHRQTESVLKARPVKV